MANKVKQPKRKFEGLWLPNEIRNIPRTVLDHLGKQILAHIYSFGEKGCFQSNETMAKIFMVSARTISRRITAIKKADLVYIKCPKGYHRTIWVKSHPDVQSAAKIWYRNKEIPKKQLESGRKQSASLRQNCPSQLDRTGEVTATNGVFPLGQNCLTTNTVTYKETNENTKAADLPLPAGGQASQLLEDRKNENIASIEQLKKTFGYGARRRTTELTSAERERRRQEQQRALQAIKAVGPDKKS